MIRKYVILLIIISLYGSVHAINSASSATTGVERPKLVIGIVIDQMRWDFLYRYYDHYSAGGFKRLLKTGFSCENTQLNYVPSLTAIGHSSIFTGTVPAIHGIAANDWYDVQTGKNVYCTEDSAYHTIGASGNSGKMSPRRLLSSTITDELRLATNFKSKVVGVSLKDRASILPAGHFPTGAFWIDDASGKFITSSYYMDSLPLWVRAFNDSKPVNKLLANAWTPVLPLSSYTNSTSDSVGWEGVLSGATSPKFPYDVQKAYEINHASLRQMPFGNTLTLKFAQAALIGYELGTGETTDFLTINCAATDYGGHLFGPNAVEVEDIYLRLDKDLAEFFSFIDKIIGKDNYLLFLTADHGAAHAEGFMEAHKMPTGFFKNMKNLLNSFLNDRFNAPKLVLSIENNQVFYDKLSIDSLGLDFETIKKSTISFLMKQEGIQYALDQDKIESAAIPRHLKDMLINGYNWQRSGSVVFVNNPGWLPSTVKTGTTHGVWNPYDTHIPLLFMGCKIKPGYTSRQIDVTDIAATLAALLHIQMPNGCIGKPIIEISK